MSADCPRCIGGTRVDGTPCDTCKGSGVLVVHPDLGEAAVTPKPQTLDDLLADAYEQLLHASELIEARETREDAARARGVLWGARESLKRAIHRFEEEEAALRDGEIAFADVTSPDDLLGGAS